MAKYAGTPVPHVVPLAHRCPALLMCTKATSQSKIIGKPSPKNRHKIKRKREMLNRKKRKKPRTMMQIQGKPRRMHAGRIGRQASTRVLQIELAEKAQSNLHVTSGVFREIPHITILKIKENIGKRLNQRYHSRHLHRRPSCQVLLRRLPTRRSKKRIAWWH